MDNRTAQKLLMSGFKGGIDGDINADPGAFIDAFYTPYDGVRQTPEQAVVALGAMLSSCRTYAEYCYGVKLGEEIEREIDGVTCLHRTVAHDRFEDSIPGLE